MQGNTFLEISMNKIITGSIFILSTTDALYCIYIHENMWHGCMSCFDQDVAFSNVNTSEKHTKYEQEE